MFLDPIIQNSQVSAQPTKSDLNITHKLKMTSMNHSGFQRESSLSISQNIFAIKKIPIFASLTQLKPQGPTLRAS